MASRQRFEAAVRMLGKTGNSVAVIHSIPGQKQVWGSKNELRNEGGGVEVSRLAPVKIRAVTLARCLHESVTSRVLIVMVNTKKERRKRFEWKAEGLL